MSPPLRRMLISIMLLIFLSAIGVVGFYTIADHTFVDALYMTVITMSTVGFGTLTDLSVGGKFFAMFLIISSAGTFLYAITNLTTLVIEGEIRRVFHQFKTSKKVAKIRDHIIICGLGRNGRETAIELIRQNQTFVVIEEDEEVISAFLEAHPGTLFIQGDATQEEVLEKAQIENAKGLISALAADAENVYIALSAREMNADINIVARAANESSISKLKRAGANEVLLPNVIGGRKMANLITRPALMEFVEMVTGENNPDLHLEVFFCQEYPTLAGKTIAQMKVRTLTGANVIGLKRGENKVGLNPNADMKLRAEDQIFVLGKQSQLEAFKEAYLE